MNHQPLWDYADQEFLKRQNHAKAPIYKRVNWYFLGALAFGIAFWIGAIYLVLDWSMTDHGRPVPRITERMR